MNTDTKSKQSDKEWEGKNVIWKFIIQQENIL